MLGGEGRVAEVGWCLERWYYNLEFGSEEGKRGCVCARKGLSMWVSGGGYMFVNREVVVGNGGFASRAVSSMPW